MNKKIGIMSMLLGVVLIGAALMLIINNQNEEQQATDSVNAIMPIVHDYASDATGSQLMSVPVADLPNVFNPPSETEDGQPAAQPEDTDSNPGSNAGSNNGGYTGSNNGNYTSNYSGSVYTAAVNGYSYLGYLTIPALNLELPVMTDWSYSRLKIAPCRYYGLHHTDNMVIAAHNYKRHFGYISSLEIGDTVVFTDMQGVPIVYYVTLIETLDPYDIDGMVETGWDLTLFTCTYGGANRVTVRCERAG